MTRIAGRLTLAALLAVSSARSEAAENTAWAHPAARGIFVSWTGCDDRAAFHLYRAEPGAPSVRITPTPVRRLTHRVDLLALWSGRGTELQETLATLGVRYPEELHRVLDAGGKRTSDATLDPRLTQARGCGWMDLTAAAGRKYTYAVMVVDPLVPTAPERLHAAAAKPVERLGAVPPAPHVTASGVDGGVLLATERSSPYGYAILRATTAAGPYLPTGGRVWPPALSGEATVTWLDATAPTGQTRWYRVAAYDALGDLGPQSEAVSAAALNRTRPEITGIEKGQAGWTVRWAQVRPAGIKGFNVYASSSMAARGDKLNAGAIPVGARSFTATRPARWVRVGAVGADGRERESFPVEVR